MSPKVWKHFRSLTKAGLGAWAKPERSGSEAQASKPAAARRAPPLGWEDAWRKAR